MGCVHILHRVQGPTGAIDDGKDGVVTEQEQGSKLLYMQEVPDRARLTKTQLKRTTHVITD